MTARAGARLRAAPRAGAGGLLAAALACGGGPADDTGTPTLRAALSSEPVTYSLLGGSDAASELIGRLVTDSLVQYGPDLELHPMLAESWQVDPDGQGIRFRLRQDVLWHDGRPFTAEDVLFSVEVARDPRSRAHSYVTQFKDLISVEAPDPHTVVARYGEPYADFLEGWTLPIIPKHAVDAEVPLLESAFAERPTGCGPFRFVEAVRGSRIVLESNESYWGGAPGIPRIEFSVLPDERTAFQALLSRQIHIAGLTPDLYDEIRDRNPPGVITAVYFPLRVWYAAWNQDGSNPFFDDARVRRAMVHALDRERFAREALHGLARPVATTYLPGTPWEDPSVTPWPYDPAEARRLLEAAGWRDADGDGVRERDGRRFRFTLLLASTQEIGGRIAAWTQQSLREVGVEMEIENLEWGALLERRRARQFQALMASWNFTPIPDQYELYHSSGRREGMNFFGLSDPEVDALLEQGRRTFDPEERRRIYRRLQRRLHELEPVSTLFQLAGALARDERLQGVEPSPLGVWRTTPGPRAWSWSDD